MGLGTPCNRRASSQSIMYGNPPGRSIRKYDSQDLDLWELRPPISAALNQSSAPPNQVVTSASQEQHTEHKWPTRRLSYAHVITVIL